MYGVKIAPSLARSGFPSQGDDESRPWGGDTLAIVLDYGEQDGQDAGFIDEWLYIGRPMAKRLHDALGAFLVKDAQEQRNAS